MNPFVAIIYSMWFVDSLSFCLQHQPPSSTPPPETRRPGPLCRRCHTWPPQSHSGRPGPDPAHLRRGNSPEIRPHLCLILVFLGVTVTSCSWTSLNIIEHHWTSLNSLIWEIYIICCVQSVTHRTSEANSPLNSITSRPKPYYHHNIHILSIISKSGWWF